MKIVWDRVTWYSQVVAIILFVGVFLLGLWIGVRFLPYGEPSSALTEVAPPSTTSVRQVSNTVSTITYRCVSGKEIQAQFEDGRALLSFSDDKPDTYKGCVQIAAPLSP